MNKSKTLVLLVLGLVPLALHAAEGELSTEREIFKDYIETRRIIGEETAEWTTGKASITDMIAVLTAERDELKKITSELTAIENSGGDKRSQLNARLEAAREVTTAFNDKIASLEGSVSALVVRLPEPLRKEIAPLIARIPADPARTRLSYSQRIQTLVGMLVQINKFNASLKYLSEIKSLDAGSFEVETLYIGLGAALFSDPAGAYAGYGHPSDTGWDWVTVKGDAALRIRKALDTYLSKSAPEFVSVPVKID